MFYSSVTMEKDLTATPRVHEQDWWSCYKWP